MSKKLLILGAKGVGKRVVEIAEQEPYTEIAFLETYPDHSDFRSYPIIGGCDDLEKFKNDYSHAFVCMADPKTRLHFIERLIAAGYEIPNIIHPQASVSKSAVMGIGINVDALSVIGPDVKIGDGCMINIGVMISHDSELSEYVTVSPSASTMGYVKLGKYTFVGGGACIVNNVSIGENVLIAAGAVVVSDLPDNVLAAGVPATVKKSITEMKHMVWPGSYPEGKL